MFAPLGILNLLRRSDDRPYAGAAAMVGARPGDTVLFCGAGQAGLAGAVGAVTGLNGQTTVVDPEATAADRVAAGAAAEGALVDFEHARLTALPFDENQWDLVVFPAGLAALEAGALVLAEAIRVVRPAGRIVLLDEVRRPGLSGLMRRAPLPAQPADTVVVALAQAGLRGVRLLAELDGLRYFEGTKPRTAPGTTA